MAIYAIGDVQGCLNSLQALLEKIHFNSTEDQLWFVGDLVNRGPDSLGVLRFVKQLGDSAITVLGNHDLHLLAVAHGLRADKHHDLVDILHANDKDELLHWLRQRPLLHHDTTSGFTLIHAGLPPQWDLATAQQCAQELETVLRGNDYTPFLAQMYGDQPDRWSVDLHGMDRLRFICNCFTRLRYCEIDGRVHDHLQLDDSGNAQANAVQQQQRRKQRRREVPESRDEAENRIEPERHLGTGGRGTRCRAVRSICGGRRACVDRREARLRYYRNDR